MILKGVIVPGHSGSQEREREQGRHWSKVILTGEIDCHCGGYDKRHVLPCLNSASSLASSPPAENRSNTTDS